MNIQDVLPLFPEVRDEGSGYKMFNDAGTELEVGEFLYGMARIIKPTNILETGTHVGISSSFFGLALKENGFGRLHTIEYEEQHIRKAKELWQKLDIQSRIISYHCSSMDFEPRNTFRIIFLDTEPNLRFSELVKFYPFLEEGGYVFVHDLPKTLCQGNVNPDHPEISSWPFGDLPQEIRQWERTGSLVRFSFPSPRGLVGWYKREKNDYVIQ